MSCSFCTPIIEWDKVGAPIQAPLIDHYWVVIVSNPWEAETKVYSHHKRRRNAENEKQEMERLHPAWEWEMITNKELAQRVRPLYIPNH